MRTTIIRCGICEHWHNHAHCPSCGAFTFIVNGKREYVNRLGLRMARGIPMQLHKVVRQDWRDDARHS